MPNPRYQLQTLSRALDVLETIQASPSPLSLTEIAGRLGEAMPIVFRILHTLEARGYVLRRPSDKRYLPAGGVGRAIAIGQTISVLRAAAAVYSPQGATISDLSRRAGLDERVTEELIEAIAAEGVLETVGDPRRWRLSSALLEIVQPLLRGGDLMPTIHPVMERLRDRTGETASLFFRSGMRQVVAVVVPSRHPVRYVLDVGTSFPLHLGAAGKAALAALDDAELVPLLDRLELTQLTSFAPDRETLLAEIARIRKRGYALSSGERIEGATAIAAPVRDTAGQVRAVASLMMPTFRTTPEGLTALGEILVRELASVRIAPLDSAAVGHAAVGPADAQSTSSDPDLGRRE